jgi:hypothetical protein
MTPTEDRLRDVLREVTPEPAVDVRYEGVAALVRQRRRTRSVMAGAIATVAVVLGGAGGFALLGTAHRAAPEGRSATHLTTATSTPGPTPTSTAAGSGASVDFEGVSIRVPTGWSVGVAAWCGLTPDRTVALPQPFEFFASCAMSSDPVPVPRSLTLNRMVRWDSGFGWGGTATIWHGQPASVSTDVYLGATRAILALPWLNTAVESTASSRAEAMAQLGAVSIRLGTGIGVPANADAVELESYPAPAVPGQTLRAHVTRPQDVAALLADLRAGGLVTDPAAACARNLTAASAVLTVRSGETFRTFFAVFGDCQLVTSNTGVAARTSNRLLADVDRLAAVFPPENGQVGSPGGCVSGGGAPPPSAPGVAPTTRQGALTAFLAGHPVGYPAAPGAWYEVDSGVFISGYAQVVVGPVPGGGRGYYVVFQRNC